MLSFSTVLTTSCGGMEEILETMEQPTANNHASKPGNDTTAVAAKKAMAYSPVSVDYYKAADILPIV